MKINPSSARRSVSKTAGLITKLQQVIKGEVELLEITN
jgi:hypothetical protein